MFNPFELFKPSNWCGDSEDMSDDMIRKLAVLAIGATVFFGFIGATAFS